VAVARKLSVLLHRLWVTGEVYDPLYNTRRRALSRGRRLNQRSDRSSEPPQSGGENYWHSGDDDPKAWRTSKVADGHSCSCPK
jgi:hypothetical protein